MPTPKSLGFVFPPEFGRQCATWLTWPRPEGISFPGKYHTVPENIARIVREIATRQDVHINVLNDNWAYLVREQLVAGGVSRSLARARVFFHAMPSNECWCRDHGPAFVVKGNRAAVVDWGFNAWGGKYPPFDADDAVPSVIARRAKLKLFKTPIVMEGGSVEFNGRGTVLTTTQCLLNNNRNPDLSRVQVENAVKAFYGQSHVLWLSEGIEGDDTDGHIDDLARFLDPRTIAIGLEDDPKDRNFKPLMRARKKLEAMRDQDGKPFRIVEVPMPGRFEYDGERLPATYMNFLFVDGACLVPTFKHRNDKKALAILQANLPRHEVVGVDCRELIWGLGAIHCLSQQVPRVPGLAARLRRMAMK